MKILITGATGFVGRTLIPYLFSHSLTDICLLVRDRQKAESMFPGLCLEIIATTEGEWCKQVIGYVHRKTDWIKYPVYHPLA